MAPADKIAILRIELEGIEPLIWRRVAVRAVASLRELHHIIQAVTGWLNCHLWQFEVGEKKYGMRIPDDPDWNEWVEDVDATKLSSLLGNGVKEFGYVYDMGDYWQHRVIVERVTTPVSEVSYPQFLGGERRCPPEDCGGVPGYHEFLKNLTSKRKEQRTHALVWYGGPYDVDDIGEQTVVAALRRIGTHQRGSR
jgi:Plasmid pRiA4b ORF-3-like protein